MTSDERLRAGDLVAIGRYRTVVSQEFADSLEAGDQVLALSHSGIAPLAFGGCEPG